MEFEVKDMSPIAKEFKEDPAKGEAHKIKQKYPFDGLDVGKCFTIPVADARLSSLRSIASRKSVEGKKFKVVVHESMGLVEVARLE